MPNNLEIWPVVPLCEAQLQDVNPDDVLNNGLYRKCNTYKGGGGYDQFPVIYNRRAGQQVPGMNNQFVVQLKGCPFKCPYCYVTEKGIRGEHILCSTNDLVSAYKDSGCSVFHLMGGAPALYLHHWPKLLRALGDTVFHSDFLLYEGSNNGLYDEEVLEEVADLSNNSLHAVSIKGSRNLEYIKNTGGVKVDLYIIWRNLEMLIKKEIPFYITFTGMSPSSVERAKKRIIKLFGADVLMDSFSIDLVHYKALDYKETEA